MYFSAGATMKSPRLVSSLILVGLNICALNQSAAASSSMQSPSSVPLRAISAVSCCRVSEMPKAQSGVFDQRELSALNLMGIRYAIGDGVRKNPRMAMRFFLRSAMQGFTPAMANIGTLYEMGAMGHANFYRAYAWVRAALSFGVLEEDHDATVLKLGMIATRLGPDNISGAERLAGAIDTCECSPSQETELAANSSP
jgi:hypothetical protein